MSHFAEIDPSTNKVIRVIVAEQDFIDSGAVGDKKNWFQTSYNTRNGVHYGTAANGVYVPDGGTALRGNYAGHGYEYHSGHDVFVPPKPEGCDSWTIDTSRWEYQSPLGKMPTDANTAAGEFYTWSESAYQANNKTGWVLNTP